MTHHLSLERAGYVHGKGSSLEQRGPFQKSSFPLATRIKQTSHTHHTKDDQSVFLPTPSPTILENQFLNALRISQVKTESILNASG